jgi:hypothetical protein
MLIDDALPEFDVVARYEVAVSASPAAAYAALRRADVGGGPLTRTLLALRALPGLVVAPRETIRRFLGGRRRSAPVTLEMLSSAGFAIVAEDPGREVVLGTIGRFWRPSGGMRRFAPAEFSAFDDPGWAKAAWSFSVTPAPHGGALLSTETRVRCTDARSRRAFRRYWWIVRPFSGLIRLEMLRAIRAEADRAGGA